MGDTTAETKALIEEARGAAGRAGYVLPITASLIGRLADALEASEADKTALCEEAEELAVELADERTAHQAVLAKVNALANDWEREAAEAAIEAAHPETIATNHAEGWQVMEQTFRDAARRLRLAVQVDQEEQP
jgi:hypothetical protein